MKIAFISDIHSNIEALMATLKRIEKEKVDHIFCLGDIVGYGPNPNECVELVRKNASKVVMGNHDSAVVHQTNTLLFNSYARDATKWTVETISDENYEYLLGLPLKISVENLLLVHSTPLIPEDWNYILSQEEAERQFSHFSEEVCFVGHSHRPEVFRAIDDRMIINVGSVGQPRDGNPDSCFLIYDTKTKEYKFIRESYNIPAVYKKIIDVGLDTFLGERLLAGR